MLRKLIGLSGKAFFGSEIDQLALEVIEKRLMQAAITTASVVFPITAIVAPYQPQGWKLAELGLGGVFGFASAHIAKSREDIELRYESNVKLSREVYKQELTNRFIKEQALADVARDVNIANALEINGLEPQAQLQYAQKFNLPSGLFAHLIPAPALASNEETVSKSHLLQLGVAEPDSEIIDLIINPDAGAILKSMAVKYPEFIRLDKKWILELIESSSRHDMGKRANHHFFICAETQAGKSTLAGVIARGIAQRSEAPAVIAGHDAKKKEGLGDVTRWLCEFTKEHKIDGYANAGKWVKLCERLTEDQLSLSSKTNGSNKGVRELILLQDEVNTCYNQGKGYGSYIDAKTAIDLQTQWLYITTNMAGCKGHGIFMGQSPLKGDTGFSGTSMSNTCFIAMGQTTGYILDPKNRSNYFRNISPETLDMLSNACSLLESMEARYALIRPTKGNPYVALIPQFDVEGILNGSLTVDVDLDYNAGVDSVEEELEHIQTVSKVSPPWEVQPSPTPNQPDKVDIKEVFARLKLWIAECEKTLGKTPTKEHIKTAWEAESGESIGDAALDYLIKRLNEP